MISFHRMTGAAALILALALIGSAPQAARADAHPNDVARYLAGLPPTAGSDVAAIADRTWQSHARAMNQSWAGVEKRQLQHIRDWRPQNLPPARDTMLYLFSGPDFLYANAFFPDATTYVLTGLEPVGRVPDVTRMPPRVRFGALRNLRASLRKILSISFFRTKDMKTDLRASRLNGTLPVLYVFLARHGNTINEVELVTLHLDGTVEPRGTSDKKGGDPGVKIGFSDESGKSKTLYYFRTNLGDNGLKKSGFRTFVKTLGPTDSLVKSASYLLHYGYFSLARELLLSQSAVLLQDDTGVPLRYFKREEWTLQPHGKYLGPIQIFAQHYQRDMRQLWVTGNAKPIRFGYGYRWRVNQSNVLVASRRQP